MRRENDMGKLYTLDCKLLTETPEIRIGEKVYPVDSRQKTVKKILALADDESVPMGERIDEALKLTNKAVVEALDGLPPVKLHCSVLAEQAVKAALADYYRRQGVDPEPIVGKLEEDCHACACEA